MGGEKEAKVRRTEGDFPSEVKNISLLSYMLICLSAPSDFFPSRHGAFFAKL